MKQEATTTPGSLRAYERARRILPALRLDLRGILPRPKQSHRRAGGCRVRGRVANALDDLFTIVGTGPGDGCGSAGALAPENPATYGQISDVLRVEGRSGDAAVMLMTGAMVTADPGLKEELIQLYRSGIDPTAALSCDIVHQHLCAAAAETVQLHLAGRNRDSAFQFQTRNQAVTEFACPAGPLDRLLSGAGTMHPYANSSSNSQSTRGAPDSPRPP